MLGVALIASGLVVLLVMWRTLWPTRATTEGWTVSDTGVDVDPGDGVDPARTGGGRRRRGRRRARRTGLFRRQPTATGFVPRQRVGEIRAATEARAAEVRADTAEVRPVDARVDTAYANPGATAYVDPGAAVEPQVTAEQPGFGAEFDWLDLPGSVPVIGTTVAGEPFRGVAPVPDGRHRRR
jgi:hypothetical protein